MQCAKGSHGRKVAYCGEVSGPFFVIATQNPSNQTVRFSLRGSLDRFIKRIELGQPDPIAERILLEGKYKSGASKLGNIIYPLVYVERTIG